MDKYNSYYRCTCWNPSYSWVSNVILGCCMGTEVIRGGA